MLSYSLRMAKDFKGYLLLLAFILLHSFTSVAQPDGKALFQANCAACHNPIKDATGPALKGVSGSCAQQGMALQVGKKLCRCN
jgi:cytochrome c551/c552